MESVAMSQFTIRYAQENGIPQILFFIKELTIYENMLNDVVVAEDLLRKWIFEKKKGRGHSRGRERRTDMLLPPLVKIWPTLRTKLISTTLNHPSLPLPPRAPLRLPTFITR